ncbi:hypothetical protein OEM_20090 [Mycobacterium intracellulare subsp. yongonense 05-1390]|uniref:hypothetical protein n=1 Tax=Mycobacterium TaxID=1763 RepID=UPI0002F5DE1D|nr:MULTISPECIES: hypothetical protein [Mycobacterium]AGP63544.1 hypothetical protein OEM_20090 [Mycobacterium intracellulare subsp. yongonense 05-1390]
MSNRSWLERIAAAAAVTLAVAYVGAAEVGVVAGLLAGVFTAVLWGAILLGQYLGGKR